MEHSQPLTSAATLKDFKTILITVIIVLCTALLFRIVKCLEMFLIGAILALYYYLMYYSRSTMTLTRVQTWTAVSGVQLTM